MENVQPLHIKQNQVQNYTKPSSLRLEMTMSFIIWNISYITSSLPWIEKRSFCFGEGACGFWWTWSLMLQVGPILMTRSEASGQTKRESPNTPMKGTKKKKRLKVPCQDLGYRDSDLGMLVQRPPMFPSRLSPKWWHESILWAHHLQGEGCCSDALQGMW